jgi:Ni/Fe-hydrogenase subunit HybB-like protein
MSAELSEPLIWPESEDPHEKLLLDPRPPAEMNAMVLNAMTTTSRRYWIFIAVLVVLVLVCLFGAWLYQMLVGMGVAGIRRPVFWGVYITNFVFWIGISHSGTFVSAILRVFRAEFRRPFTRAAELMTSFALVVAAMYPLIHLGRTWRFYWMIPYPNQRGLWPNFHSPLEWDMLAIFTYLIGSSLYLYLPLIPDLAMARDHSTGWRHTLYRILALGWRGAEAEWHHLKIAIRIFAFAIIPVMFSVHTIVAWDFAMAIQPGWHSTIFGPYFVIGALFSGVAAVIMVLAIARKTMHLEYFLRAEHFDGMGKFLLLLSLAWAYFYFNDYIVPWYGQEPVEKTLQQMLISGYAAPLWIIMLFSNVVLPWTTLWSRRIRTSVPALFFISILVQVGMYLERYIIIPVTLGRNELPYSWGIYIPHLPESVITLGAFALVGFLYVLFSRIFPLIPVWEVYEGQVMQGIRRIGKALVPSRSEPE